MNIFRSSSVVTVVNLVSRSLTFVAIILFARELGASQLGVFFLFQSILVFASVASDAGINRGIIKQMSEGDRPRKALGAGFALKTPIIVVVTIGIVALAPQLNSFIGAPVEYLLIITLLCRELGTTFNKALEGELRVGEAKIIQFIGQVVWVGSSVVFLRIGLGVEGVIYGLVLNFVSLLLLSVWRGRYLPSLPQKSDIAELFDFGKYSVVSHGGGYMYNWTDVIVIGFFIGSASVAAYEVSWRLSNMFMLVGGALGTTLLPQISQWYENGEFEQIGRTISKTVFPSMFFIIPGVVGALIVGESLLRELYGPEFVIAAGALVILTAEKLAHALNAVFSQSLNGVDRPDLVARARVVAIVLNIVLNIALVWQFGILGAAVATGIASLADTALQYRYLQSLLDIRLPIKPVVWTTVAAAGMGVVLYLVPIHIQSLLELVLTIGIGVSVFLFLVLLPPSTRTELRTLQKEIF